MNVCETDGVPVTEARSGRLIHTDELPPGVDPDHEIVPVASEAVATAEKARTDLHQLAHEMVAHHTVMHPVSDCTFALRLLEALRSRR